METTYRSEYGVLDPARVNEYSRTKPRVILSLQSERMDCGGELERGKEAIYICTGGSG